jgi:primosomal protein N' (replication factor Y)
MKTTANGVEKKFKVLSPELEALIDKTKEENERLFIWTARKGLSPSTICGDCGQTVVCTECKTPVVLFGVPGGQNFFRCNRCGETRDAAERCTNCNSWKLTTLGIGVEGVEEEIKKRFPDVTIFRMDKESVKSEKKAVEMVRKFEETPGSILLGTELALFYMKNPLENVAVASIDALFSVPDFRINEKIFYILLSLRSLAQKVFVIQTRNAQSKVLDYAIKGNLMDFYREEVADRKKFSYPPYSVFIKLSLEGKASVAEAYAKTIAELFTPWEPGIYRGNAPTRKGNVVMNILMRIPTKEWPHEEILQKIRSLPPNIAVRVDPDSLL